MARELILTGAPGAGKTQLLRELEAAGFEVIEEAATDIIALEQGRGVAEPWTDPGFTRAIVGLQMQRLARPTAGTVRVSDRSPVCTLALAEYLGHPVAPELTAAAEAAAGSFERRVLFVDLLGFIENTAARRISYAESQRFEAFHVAAYERLGFELVRIPPLPIRERAAYVREVIG
ncbi:MAG: AAA family ATPase [Devosia sp.]